MEAWLAELEMDVDPASTFMNNLCHQSEAMQLMSFDEQIDATLIGHDFSYPISAESNNTSPQCDFDNNIIDHITSPSQYFNNNINQDDIINPNNNNNNIGSSNFNVADELKQFHGKEETKKKQSGGTKRKRQPSQVQDHIIAERKRRELLGQMFISLSAIVPGLKKMDKTSVLGEAIKYMTQLKEKVKVLEEVATKRTIVVVKNSHTINNDDSDSSSTVDDSCGGGSGGGGGSNSEANNYNDSLPEVEVKLSGKTLLLRVYCEDQKGILAKLFAELDKYDVSVTNCSVVPFDSLALDITIVAQIKERSFNDNVKGFISSLRSALRLIS